MDEKTAELRDLFVETTGSDTVTERQEDGRGSLAGGDGEDRVRERLAELVAIMRDRYDFETDLGDEALVDLVRRYHEGDDDAALADALGVDADAVFRARMDLHLVREADRETSVDLDALRSLAADGASETDLVAALDADPEAIRRARAVVESEMEATRANDRFRDEFAELLTDADLSRQFAHDAREDGLREATEDIETDVSL